MSDDVKPFIEYIPGDVISGSKIKRIYSSSLEYIVYLSGPKNAVKTQYYHSGIDPISAISAKLVEVEAITQKLFNRNKYNGLIAEAYTECFVNNPENAISILNQVKQYAARDFVHQIKIVYLFCTLSLIIFNTSISLILFYTKGLVEYGSFYQYWLIATFGSFGGFLSTIYKINKLNFQEEDSKVLLFFLAISRVFLSMLASIVIYVLIKSNIMLGIFNSVENVFVFYIFSIAAGFSETFVPDILNKIHNNAVKE